MIAFFRRRPAGGTGRALVIGLVGIAVGLASFAVWFQWRQTRRCLEFYGSDAAALIQRAPRVEVWERSPSDGVGTSGMRRWDVTAARGLVHLRRGLVEDANFDWSDAETPPAASDAWEFALAFYASPDSARPAAVLVVARTNEEARLSVEGRPGSVGLGRLARGIDRWWGTARGQAPTAGP